MSRFHLDWVAEPPRVLLLRWLLLCFGALSLAILLLYSRLVIWPESETLKDRLASLRRQLQSRAVAVAMPEAELGRAWDQAVVASEMLNTEWAPMLADIGVAAGGNQVAVLNIEPEAAKGELTLTAEAHDLHRVTLFMASLEQRPSIQNVTLRSHAVARSGATPAVRFRLIAHWSSRHELEDAAAAR